MCVAPDVGTLFYEHNGTSALTLNQYFKNRLTSAYKSRGIRIKMIDLSKTWLSAPAYQGWMLVLPNSYCNVTAGFVFQNIVYVGGASTLDVLCCIRCQSDAKTLTPYNRSPHRPPTPASGPHSAGRRQGCPDVQGVRRLLQVHGEELLEAICMDCHYIFDNCKFYYNTLC